VLWRHLQSSQDCNQRLRDPVGVNARVPRFDLAQVVRFWSSANHNSSFQKQFEEMGWPHNLNSMVFRKLEKGCVTTHDVIGTCRNRCL